GAVEDGGGILRNERRSHRRGAAADVEAAEPEVGDLGADGVGVELARERRGRGGRRRGAPPRGRGGGSAARRGGRGKAAGRAGAAGWSSWCWSWSLSSRWSARSASATARRRSCRSVPRGALAVSVCRTP